MVDFPAWAQTLLTFIIGPVGAIVVMCVTIYFLWKLFREEQGENRKNFATVQTLSETVEKSVEENRQWRELVESLLPKKKA
jgi:hypothetical protein